MGVTVQVKLIRRPLIVSEGNFPEGADVFSLYIHKGGDSVINRLLGSCSIPIVLEMAEIPQ